MKKMGGIRAGAGRPRLDKNGEERKNRYIYATDDEHKQIKEYLIKIRESAEISSATEIAADENDERPEEWPVDAIAKNEDDRYKIEIKDDKAFVYTPYDDIFIKKITQSRGVWNKETSCWTVDVKKLDAARKIMKEIFLRDDLYVYDDMLTVKIIMKEENTWPWNTPVRIFGKVAARPYRDKKEVCAGDDAAIVKGSLTISTAGSRRDYIITINEGTEILLYDVPRSKYEKYLKQAEEDDIYKVILEGEEEKTIEELREEKERLVMRIKEIERKIAVKEKQE
ncbi:MAG: hypothetical protein K5982_01515 [Selenomonadaceae bacterium]|nr:hypothetical protein [Selenomonadaceae bacterium]